MFADFFARAARHAAQFATFGFVRCVMMRIACNFDRSTGLI